MNCIPEVTLTDEQQARAVQLLYDIQTRFAGQAKAARLIVHLQDRIATLEQERDDAVLGLVQLKHFANQMWESVQRRMLSNAQADSMRAALGPAMYDSIYGKPDPGPMGTCCYGGRKLRSDCASCAGWRADPPPPVAPDWCPTCTKPYAECRCNGVAG